MILFQDMILIAAVDGFSAASMQDEVDKIVRKNEKSI